MVIYRCITSILFAKTRTCFSATVHKHLVQKVTLLDVSPTYAHIRYSDGCESSVSIHDLAPWQSQTLVSKKSGPDTTAKDCFLRGTTIPAIKKNPTEKENNTDILCSSCKNSSFEETVNALSLEGQLLCCSQRISHAPQQYGW